MSREESASFGPSKRRKRFGPGPTEPSGDAQPPQSPIDVLIGRRCRSVECYERLNYIDEGTYGLVYRARDVLSGHIVALKQVKLAGEREGFPVTALREIGLLLSLRHENVVHVREVVVGATMDKIYMAMDYAEHDVRSVLDRIKHPYSQSEVKSLLRQILRGVAYMHRHWVLHRDLKTSNLLLNQGGVVKICDFGLARRFADPPASMTPGVTTLWYRAPEVLLGATTYSTAVDMWSVGCIFAELVLGEALFSGKGEIDQIQRVFGLMGKPTEDNWPGVMALPTSKRIALNGPPKSELRTLFVSSSYGKRTPLSRLGVELLEAMLTPDPAQRVSAAEALQHPYFDEAPAPAPPHLIQTLPVTSRQGK